MSFDASGFMLLLLDSSDPEMVDYFRKCVTDEFDTIREYPDVVVGIADKEIETITGIAFLIHIKTLQSITTWAEGHNIDTFYISADIDDIGSGEQVWTKITKNLSNI